MKRELTIVDFLMMITSLSENGLISEKQMSELCNDILSFNAKPLTALIEYEYNQDFFDNFIAEYLEWSEI